MDKTIYYSFSLFFISGLLTQSLINYKWWIGYPFGMILFVLLMIMHDRYSSKQKSTHMEDKE